MAYVCAFMMSRYCSAVDRVQKPFNPLLGETYELVTNKFRLITHNSDVSFNHQHLNRLLPYVSEVYPINCALKGSTIIKKIPLGFIDNVYKPHHIFKKIMNFIFYQAMIQTYKYFFIKKFVLYISNNPKLSYYFWIIPIPS